MKKLLAVCLAGMLCLGGCMNETAKDVFVTPVRPDATTTSFLYTPGSYTGTGQGYNGPIEVRITVNEANIISIDLVSHNEANYILQKEMMVPVEEGEEESTDEKPVDEDPSGQPAGPKMKTVIVEEPVEVIGRMDTAINEILANQTTNLEMDLYTGATVTVRGLLEAITNASSDASLR